MTPTRTWTPGRLARGGLLALAIAAALTVGVLVRLRGMPEPSLHVEAKGVVSGTVTGRYGVAWDVHLIAEADGRPLADAWSDPNGRYSLEVPADVPFELRAVPFPQTYLIAERRALTLKADEKKDVPFDLKTRPSASGTIVGPAGPIDISLCAVREDAPPGTGGWYANLHGLAFRFWWLETDVTYRLEVPGLDWALERPVVFRGGESGIVAPVRRLLGFDLRVKEVVSGNAIPAFTVKVLNPNGGVFATLEGKDGRLCWQAPHPDPAGPKDRRWTMLVGANGYFEEPCPWFGYTWVFLQQVRDPNITLMLRLEDGTPFDGDLVAKGVARQGFGGVDARATKAGPGRYTAVLPPGRWWIRLEPGGDYGGRSCDVTVADRQETVVDVPPLVRRQPENRPAGTTR